jgi:ABC-2 type transport system permease protein
MRLFSIVQKSFRIQLRDYWVLLLTLSASPFFVMIYWLMSTTGNTTYRVLLIDHDQPAQESSIRLADSLINLMETARYADNKPIIQFRTVVSREESFEILKNRDAEMVLEIPASFTNRIQQCKSHPDSLRPETWMAGDASNPRYSIAAIMAYTYVEEFVKRQTGLKSVVTMNEEFIGNSVKRTEFDVYVPGMLIFSLIMLLFSAAMVFIRDIEDQTIKRLKISRMTAWEYFIGTGISQVVLGTISVILTFLLAKALGFNYTGNLGLAVIIGFLTILAILGITLILVSFCRNATTVLTFGNFPMFLLMFFSGAMLPLPTQELFNIAGKSVSWNAILPPTHAVNALNKILISGAGFSDIWFELACLLALIIAYSWIGIWLFKKKHLRAMSA